MTLMQEVLDHTKRVSDRLALARTQVTDISRRMVGSSVMDGPACAEEKVREAPVGDLNVLKELVRGMASTLSDLEEELISIEKKF